MRVCLRIRGIGWRVEQVTLANEELLRGKSNCFEVFSSYIVMFIIRPVLFYFSFTLIPELTDFSQNKNICKVITCQLQGSAI